MNTKTCTKCGDTKPTTEFTRNKGSRDGLYPSCKACRKAYDTNNADRIAEYKKQYRADNAEKIAERQKQYREANAERIAEYDKQYRADNIEARREYGREYARAHQPDTNARRAKHQCGPAAPQWLTDEHLSEMNALYWEANRLTQETGVQHHVDHICPKTAVNDDGVHVASGLHVPWNLQVLTQKENREKSNRLPDEEVAA